MANFLVEFYTKDTGDEPAKNFILHLNKKMRAKTIGLLQILQEDGNLLREPYSKHLEDGIFEIRIKVGNDISRVLYFFYFEHKIILTHGFIKKSQKTPRKEIKLAKQYRKDFIQKESLKNEYIK